jgi:hypothetical protein
VSGVAIAALPRISVPGPGEWTLHLWLRDEAGNESAANGVDVPLRFDDQPPSVAFTGLGGGAAGAADAAGGQVTASVSDPLSGPAAGTILYRRADAGGGWIGLTTALHADGPGKATLSAPLPDLAAGTWVFRAEASDGAGNGAVTSQRADGSSMTITVPGGPEGGAGRSGKDGASGRDGAGGNDGSGTGDARGGGGSGGTGDRRARTRIFARLRAPGARGPNRRRATAAASALTVPFGTPAQLSGRLTSGGGVGLAGRSVRVLVRPSHGALAPPTVVHLRTGKAGGFSLRLPAGTSRRIAVTFAGNEALAPAGHRSLDLRVRSGATLAVAPRHLSTGDSVHLSGRVRNRAAPIPRRGKLVAIQYLESDSGRWRPALVIRTDHAGRFHARYRFRYVSGTARIRLRATALAEERWPYAPGSSTPITVEVHGG